MKQRLYILLCLMLFANFSFAQDARQLLDKASKAYENAGGISAKFTLESKDGKNKYTYSQDGIAHMQGDKFKIDVPDGTTWFDGKTQWVYVKDTEEVNITNPTGDELLAISPSAMLNIYKLGFDLKYIGEKTVNGKLVHEIEMYPQASVKKAGSDIKLIVIQIDKATNIFSKIAITEKSGYINTVSIKDIKLKQNLNEQTFKFDKKNYPQVELVDLR